MNPDAHGTPASISRATRRRFLSRGLLGAAALWGASGGLSRRAHAAAPSFELLDTKVISHQDHLYHGWSTVARRQSGDLWLVWSGGREAHVCPFGQLQGMLSRDGGDSWTWPRVLLDSGLDDRDAGVLETAEGTLLVTTFSSLAYAPQLEHAESTGDWPDERLARWQAAHARLDDATRDKELGQWMLRSTDGGVTWSRRYNSIVNSPHGPIQLSDGRLLYAGKELWSGQRRVGVCESTDDGRTWKWLAEIPPREGDQASDYHELHAVECEDKRLVVHIRNHNEAHRGETLQSESDDGGETWTVPRSIGVWGLPSHLLRLRDGRLLMSYGHRRAPLGNQARLSEDHGATWSEPMILSDDGASGDLGYPSTVELDDGTLLSVWYELLQGQPNAVLRQARWRLG